jgi:hypothetical protein
MEVQIMKNSGFGGKLSRFNNLHRTTFLLALFALFFLFNVAEVKAAQITFAPNGATISATPGETVSVPVVVTLSGTSLPNAYASFSLAQTGGNLSRSWINGQAYLSLNSWYKTRQTVLRINVPAEAAGGLYRGVFGTAWLRSNEEVAPASFEINLEVSSSASCNQPSVFSDIVSSEETIETRNNKQVAIELSGSVTIAEGCSIDNAWYQLTDEYGELDQTETVTVDSDGAFTVSVPMVASRKGNDKDGRLYSVVFFAESDAGVFESPETRVVVLHDNGKK